MNSTTWGFGVLAFWRFQGIFARGGVQTSVFIRFVWDFQIILSWSKSVEWAWFGVTKVFGASWNFWKHFDNLGQDWGGWTPELGDFLFFFSKNVFILLDRALHGRSKTGGHHLLFAEKFQTISPPRFQTWFSKKKVRSEKISKTQRIRTQLGEIRI